MVASSVQIIGGEWNHIGLRFEAKSKLHTKYTIGTSLHKKLLLIVFIYSCHSLTDIEWNYCRLNNKCSDISGAYNNYLLLNT